MFNIKEYMKKYYIKNKDTIQAYRKKYKKENPIKWKLAKIKRQKRYRKNNVIKKRARDRANHQKLKTFYCYYCYINNDLHFHHTNYEKDEGFTLCRGCHNWVHAH